MEEWITASCMTSCNITSTLKNAWSSVRDIGEQLCKFIRWCDSPNIIIGFDIHGSVHHDTMFTKITNKIQLCRIIYCSLTALHVYSDIFAYHQEHLNLITVSGFIHVCRRLLPWQQPTMTHVNKTRSCNYSLDAPDDEQKYSSKHVGQSRNNKLSYTVESCW
jgi:hypothetical protein